MHILGAAALEPNDTILFLLSLAVLLGLARVLGELARRFKQPVVLGEILAGVLLGPTVFGTVSPDWFIWLFPSTGSTFIALEGFVLLAATLLLLVVGLDVDLSMVVRQGRAALSVSMMGIGLPFAIGFTLALTVPQLLGQSEQGDIFPFAIFMGIAMSITALPVIAKILMDLNIARSDMGVLVLSSAMLNDLVGWIGFAVVLAMMAPGTDVLDAVVSGAVVSGAVASGGVASGGDASGGGVVMTIGMTLLFLVGMLTIGRYLAHRALPYVQAHWAWPGGVLVFVSVIGLLCAAVTEKLGIHSIFGAFIAGVAIGDSHHLRERTRDTIHQFATNIFAPVFFASIGLRVNFIDQFDLVVVLLVFASAFVGKVGGCYFGARFCKMSLRESWGVGFGMAAQGVVGIILGQMAYNAGLITEELLVAIVIMALTTSLIAGPAMQTVLRLKQRRTLLNLLTDRHIIRHPVANSVEEVIREMSQRAGEITGLGANMIARAAIERERIMHTGLPNGLAIPHARITGLTKPCIVISLHHQGIDFDSPDDKLAQIICMLLTPADQPDSQIELLSLFATTFDHAPTRQSAIQAESSTEFLAVLNLAEAERNAQSPDAAHEV